MARRSLSTTKLEKKKKKTSIGNSPYTKTGRPGPKGQSKRYKKKYRGQGR